MRKWIYAFLAMLFVVMGISLILQGNTLRTAKNERDRHKANVSVLMSDVRRYRVRDSLSAMRVKALELRVGEYKRMMDDDAELIAGMKIKIKDLQNVSKVQTEMITRLRAIPKDTVIVVDSMPRKAVKISVRNKWYDLDGLMTNNAFDARLAVRDSLIITESVEYKKFLWFRTRKIKSYNTDVVSINPYVKISGVDVVRIVK